MDTLMDKLASKLNAQEMIRANGEAEAQQMNFLKTQVSEYQGCLDRLSQVCDELGTLENRIGNLSLPDNSASEEAIGEIRDKLEAAERKLNELGESLEKAGNNDESLHKEGVRIYKNIQASMVNELEPIEEAVKDYGKKTLGETKAVKTVAIVALCVSGVSLLLQIYNMVSAMGLF
ncbi:MAG: hypothetical protein IJ195_08100 [Lachnospiraceae bacterium]|nr:hypothetical protein [Lachnospiraceae bacterium]MBR1650294.1 hypothetical protein [Lachnospiraceae bacterium]